MRLRREATSCVSVIAGFVFVTCLLFQETSAITTADTTYTAASYTSASDLTDSSSSTNFDYSMTSFTTKSSTSSQTSDSTAITVSSSPWSSESTYQTQNSTSTTSSGFASSASVASDSPSSTTSAAVETSATGSETPLVPDTLPATSQTQGTKDMSTMNPQPQDGEKSKSETNDVQLLPWVIVHSIVLVLLIIVIVCGGLYFRRRLSRGQTHRARTIEEAPVTVRVSEGGGCIAAESDCAPVAPDSIELENIYSSTAGNRASEHLYGSLGAQGIYSSSTTAPLVDGAPPEHKLPPRSPKKGRRQKGHKKDKTLERAHEASERAGSESGDGSFKEKLYENMSFR